MVRPTGIELVSSAPQADTLSIELWALKSDLVLRFSHYPIILTFFRFTNCYNKHKKEEKTGTYVYDKKLGKMVKVSDRIPSVHKAAHSCCGGCCGHCGCHDD